MKSIQSTIIAASVSLLALPSFAADAVSGTSANNAGATSTGTSTGQSAGGTSPNTAAPSPATRAGTAASTMSPGYYITGGHVYRIENGRATRVMEPQTMRISPNGIIGFDGRPLTIPDGQMMSADGRLIPLPSNVSGLPNVGTGVREGLVPSATGNAAGTNTNAAAGATGAANPAATSAGAAAPAAPASPSTPAAPAALPANATDPAPAEATPNPGGAATGAGATGGNATEASSATGGTGVGSGNTGGSGKR